jgi:hypothetical protein
MARVQIDLTGRNGKVLVDGVDVSSGVSSVDLHLHADAWAPKAKVTLGLAVCETTVDGEATVKIPPGTRDALVALGWTPPQDLPGPVDPPEPPPVDPPDDGDTGNPDWDNPPEPPDHPDEPGQPGGGTTTPPPSPTPPSPPPAGVRYPADLFGPDRWKITLPTSTNGKVDEVKPPAFATYSSKYFELNSTRDGAIFRVWHGGDTTQNSKNPRSELRERWNNDPEGYWAVDGKLSHRLHVVGQINRFTKVKPHIVCAQLHNRPDDVWVLRIEGPNVYITNWNDTHAYPIISNYRPGDLYDFEALIRPNGETSFKYNGKPVAGPPKTTGKEFYFKGGLYLQSNPSTAPSESTEEYGEIVLYKCEATHF